MHPFSPHAGFFASLKQVEDRLALEQQQQQPSPPPKPQPSPFADPLTTSPIFLDPNANSGGESSGPAQDFLTFSTDQERHEDGNEKEYENDNGDDDNDDVERLMALLGLSPPPVGSGGGDEDSGGGGGGCDCSGGDGFLAKVVGVVGPKCEKERRRVDRWIEYYCRGGGYREPARLAHLLLAKASCSWDGEGPGNGVIGFPATVNEFLEHDPPPWPSSSSSSSEEEEE